MSEQPIENGDEFALPNWAPLVSFSENGLNIAVRDDGLCEDWPNEFNALPLILHGFHDISNHPHDIENELAGMIAFRAQLDTLIMLHQKKLGRFTNPFD